MLNLPISIFFVGSCQRYFIENVTYNNFFLYYLKFTFVFKDELEISVHKHLYRCVKCLDNITNILYIIYPHAGMGWLGGGIMLKFRNTQFISTLTKCITSYILR